MIHPSIILSSKYALIKCQSMVNAIRGLRKEQYIGKKITGMEISQQKLKVFTLVWIYKILTNWIWNIIISYSFFSIIS